MRCIFECISLERSLNTDNTTPRDQLLRPQYLVSSDQWWRANNRRQYGGR